MRTWRSPTRPPFSHPPLQMLLEDRRYDLENQCTQQQCICSNWTACPSQWQTYLTLVPSFDPNNRRLSGSSSTTSLTDILQLHRSEWLHRSMETKLCDQLLTSQTERPVVLASIVQGSTTRTWCSSLWWHLSITSSVAEAGMGARPYCHLPCKCLFLPYRGSYDHSTITGQCQYEAYQFVASAGSLIITNTPPHLTRLMVFLVT